MEDPQPGTYTINVEEWPYSPKFHDFATFLGLETARDAKGTYWRGDETTAKKIEQIYVWGKNVSQSDDPIEIKVAIKNLTRDLGVTFRGMPLVKHLWGWIELNSNKEKIEKAMSLFKETKTPPIEQAPIEIEVRQPNIKPEVIEERVKQHAQEIGKNIQSTVQRTVTSSINRGIQSALRNYGVNK